MRDLIVAVSRADPIIQPKEVNQHYRNAVALPLNVPVTGAAAISIFFLLLET